MNKNHNFHKLFIESDLGFKSKSKKVSIKKYYIYYIMFVLYIDFKH